MGISKAQFYKDKKVLAELGFVFEYNRNFQRWTVTHDPTLPIENLTLTEQLCLVFSLKQFSAIGDYVVAFEALNAARKLAAGLPVPLRENLFEDFILKEGFGCPPGILDRLQAALNDRKRVIISYQSPGQKMLSRHEVEPYSLFFRRRALYVEGYSWTKREFRMFRLNRVQKVIFTAYGFTQAREGYDFGKRHGNAFSAFPGETTEHVVVRFSERISDFIEETLWHHSQAITENPDGGIRFEVDVAEPREVMWWAFFWGSDAEIVEPGWLREEAKVEIAKMNKRYCR